ncbi:hypothetical protein P3S67_012813 [Capsicum chacoense]
MRFDRVEDFVNVMSKSVYYINAKDGYVYQMRPFIYDAKFKSNEETTQVIFSLIMWNKYQRKEEL